MTFTAATFSQRTSTDITLTYLSDFAFAGLGPEQDLKRDTIHGTRVSCSPKHPNSAVLALFSGRPQQDDLDPLVKISTYFAD
jgi:hypothetical protein